MRHELYIKGLLFPGGLKCLVLTCENAYRCNALHEAISTQVRVVVWFQSYTSYSLLICFRVQYTCMIYLDIQLTLVSVKQLIFILIFKLRTVLWKLNCTCICFFNSPTCRTRMAPLDPDSLIMRGRGFLESGMTLTSNILLKIDVARWMQ